MRKRFVIGVTAAGVTALGAQTAAQAEVPAPTRAPRDILPMSTGVPVKQPAPVNVKAITHSPFVPGGVVTITINPPVSP